MTDVIVLGLGGMGSAACYQLAKRGAKVTAIEQFSPGHAFGSSHGETRIIRKAYFEHRDYVPLLERAYELWRELESASGEQLYRPVGVDYFLPPQSPILAGIRESSARYGIPLRDMASAEILSAKKFHVPPGHMVLREPESGYLEVEKCVVQHTELARKLGARIVSGEKVISWQASRGQVTVKTDRETYTAEKLVIAAGAWSGPLLASLKLPFKILQKTMLWFPASAKYSAYAQTPCFFYELPYGIFYGFPAMPGETVLKVARHSGGKVRTTPLTPTDAPDEDETSAICRFVAECLPDVRPEFVKRASCMYTMTPDEHFVIDLHPEHANVSIAAGFSGHGFKFASVVGEILADLATQGKTALPIEFLRVGRF